MKKIITTIGLLILLIPTSKAQKRECQYSCHDEYTYNINALQEYFFYATAQECTPFLNNNQGDYAILESYIEGVDLFLPPSALNTIEQYFDCLRELNYIHGEAMNIIADTYFNCIELC
ncbi:hypothetical protein D0809_19180 [Flavobacterium circumlabens]|uniref:Uncharacterized protein n=1 Tax=Flavobacterium circumlabens TaxID=2133765 RepID=A0A4Y7U7U3_9FLAO|nr:hypothetical protein [Flavobacterium circumlabens]TCN53924.1 hypothetical protein EV142_108231 [Flavobacterium circumlabens]TEB42490.1 hypothetical protein D0809_19180 [Flavobacterium circumlabens]